MLMFLWEKKRHDLLDGSLGALFSLKSGWQIWPLVCSAFFLFGGEVLFGEAAVIGWSVIFLGCFVGHVMSYYATNNTAPYNIGPYIWFYDLLLPVLVLALLYSLRYYKKRFL